MKCQSDRCNKKVPEDTMFKLGELRVCSSICYEREKWKHKRDLNDLKVHGKILTEKERGVMMFGRRQNSGNAGNNTIKGIRNRR